MKRLLTCILSLCLLCTSYIAQTSQTHAATSNIEAEIDKIVKNEMTRGDLPAASVLVMHKGKTIANKGYGTANIADDTPATDRTRYPIASNTKAFTGYAIQQLAHEGKLKLSDPVTKYLPWFKMKYDGDVVPITIEQLLAQTSGIATNITDHDEITKSNNHLEGLVKSVAERELQHRPGKIFEYSNMNYNILGLIVQTISGESYSDYMKQHVLQPLGMTQTDFLRPNHETHFDAKGYTLEHGKRVALDPSYNIGDTPSAYMRSSTSDLKHWIQHQLHPKSDNAKSIVKASHQPLTYVDNQQGYASGWFTSTEENRIYHTGDLPQSASMIMLNPKEDSAIVVLSNINSPHVLNIADQIDTLLSHTRFFEQSHYDAEQALQIANTLIVLSIIVAVLTLVVLSRLFYLVANGQRLWSYTKQRILYTIALTIATVIALLACYFGPLYLLGASDWQAIYIWIPMNARAALYCVLGTIGLLWLYGASTILSKK